jgi:hypothetical protein
MVVLGVEKEEGDLEEFTWIWLFEITLFFWRRYTVMASSDAC